MFKQSTHHDNQVNAKSLFLKKGQKIQYEGEEAEVIKVTPLLILKTETRVICGEPNDSLWTKPFTPGR